ncbi:hypothetical protein CCHR01_03481 [Colletotrichum chrysophilum]|uniref:Uncharacterized protein n=1 Tax=Colletotrichum chrysophilum TaxID=1836956 RepID=A0AAD9ATN1_9PEZI|nr:hypothetical protein CCHR01_03481 [Colletotrichum chrysophilum]
MAGWLGTPAAAAIAVAAAADQTEREGGIASGQHDTDAETDEWCNRLLIAIVDADSLSSRLGLSVLSRRLVSSWSVHRCCCCAIHPVCRPRGTMRNAQSAVRSPQLTASNPIPASQSQTQDSTRFRKLKGVQGNVGQWGTVTWPTSPSSWSVDRDWTWSSQLAVSVFPLPCPLSLQ